MGTIPDNMGSYFNVPSKKTEEEILALKLHRERMHQDFWLKGRTGIQFENPLATFSIVLVSDTVEYELVSKKVDYRFFLRLLLILSLLSAVFIIPMLLYIYVSYMSFICSFYLVFQILRLVLLIIEDMKFWNKKYKIKNND